MASEPLYSQRRPGFPRRSFTESSKRTVIEYVGLSSDLIGLSPKLNESWGDYDGIVTGADHEPLESTDYGILTVTVELKFTENGNGELQEVTTEIDWVDVSRPLYEHPKFAAGGSYALSSTDVAAIEKWKLMDDVEKRADYKYYKVGTSGETGTLSSNAKRFARGIEYGIEFWVDKAPVARRSETYAGGPGPTGSAGQKQSPSGVTGVPTGYEWVRNADRSVKAGGDTRWRRDIEWIGCKKVLIDKDDIFWNAP